MKKSLIFNIRILFIVLGVIVCTGKFIFADTVISGVVGDSVVITVEPFVMDFGIIPYGTNVTHPGLDIVMNTTGSETTSGNVNIDISITGDDSVFYSSLLELEEDGTSTWTDVSAMGTIIMPKDSIKVFHTQLNGDTTINGGAGPKDAVLVYTATAEMINESRVTRTFSSTNVSQGEIVDVDLSVAIMEGETLYAIEEYIPSGWVVTGNGGGNTTNPNKLAWAVIDNATDVTYSYSVQAPNETGDYFFNGSYMFENFIKEKTILGDTTVQVN